LPPHSAESLWLSGRPHFNLKRLRLSIPRRSHKQNQKQTERQSLSALGGGIAALRKLKELF
jgi:hypothetical protein